MGFSHFTSLQNDRFHYKIDIFDSNKKQYEKKIIKNKKKKIYFLNQLPKKKKYSLVIISTGPEHRFRLSKNILKNNNVKILLLEKFLFKTINEFNKFKELIKKSRVRVFVNIWSKIIYEKLNISKIKNNHLNINIKLPKNSLLTNVVHFYYLLQLFVINKKISISYKRSELFVKNKNNPYDEVNKMITLQSDKNRIRLHSTVQDIFSIEIKSSDNRKLYIFKNNNLVRKDMGNIDKFRFPIAKFLTSKFYNNFEKKGIKLLPEYHQVSGLSMEVLRSANKYFKKKLIIK